MKRRNHESGFTILEIMIVVTIVMILALIILVLINPQAQIIKVQDARRKRDLNQMAKIFEEYYSDHNNYPIHNDVCIDTPIEDNGICSCHVCGLSSQESLLKKYASRLYCDPDSPKNQYLYQYDCGVSPRWFRVCVTLKGTEDTSLIAQYNYGVSSSNTDVNLCSLYVEQLHPTTYPNPTNTPVVPTSTPIILPTNTPVVPTITPGGPTNTPIPTSTPTPTTVPLPTCYPDPERKWCYKSGCNDCGYFGNCLNPASCNEPFRLFTATCAQECTY